MRVIELQQRIDAILVTGEGESLTRQIKGGHVSDLLSDVMGNAREGFAWFTIQTHPNVVAVALLLNLSVIVFTAGQAPEEGTIKKAQEEGIVLMKTELSTFESSGRLYQALNEDEQG